MAKELKVSHVLDGSVRRAGERVHGGRHLAKQRRQDPALWSDRYDRSLDDIFAVQDEISEASASRPLDQTFTRFRPRRSIRRPTTSTCAAVSVVCPNELRANVGLLETATQRAPNFAEAWERLAYVRTWARFYQPFAERGASAAVVTREAERALALDPQNIDALTAQYYILPPYGSFIVSDAAMERIRRTPGRGVGHGVIGWHARTIGRVRESAEITEGVYRLDPLN